MPGNSTPITPILAPAIMLPTKIPVVPKALRTAMPAAKVSRMPKTTRSLPKRRASIGANGANRPRQRTGNVVSRPACAALKPKLSETRLSSGAMLDNAGRKFSATSTRPTSNSQGRLSSTGCCCTCSSSTSASISNSSSSGPLAVAAVRVASCAMAVSQGQDSLIRVRLRALALAESRCSMASRICPCRSKTCWQRGA
ncbi:hypothetical protein D3C78_935810 [compost metagenome]